MRTKVMRVILPLTFCMALAVGVQAKSGKSHSSSNQGKSMSLTGCLQTGSSPNTYVLNNIGESTHASQKSSQSSTPGAMARSEGSYTLIPSGNVNLQNWVGKRVRVTGRMSSDSSMSGSSSSSTGSQSSTDMSSTSSSMSGSSELKVTSVKKASGTCQ